MLVSTPSPIAMMPVIHGIHQTVDIKQPMLEYQPLVRKVDGVAAYQHNWEVLSKRLWIC